MPVAPTMAAFNIAILSSFYNIQFYSLSLGEGRGEGPDGPAPTQSRQGLCRADAELAARNPAPTQSRQGPQRLVKAPHPNPLPEGEGKEGAPAYGSTGV